MLDQICSLTTPGIPRYYINSGFKAVTTGWNYCLDHSQCTILIVFISFYEGSYIWLGMTHFLNLCFWVWLTSVSIFHFLHNVSRLTHLPFTRRSHSHMLGLFSCLSLSSTVRHTYHTTTHTCHVIMKSLLVADGDSSFVPGETISDNEVARCFGWVSWWGVWHCAGHLFLHRERTEQQATATKNESISCPWTLTNALTWYSQYPVSCSEMRLRRFHSYSKNIWYSKTVNQRLGVKSILMPKLQQLLYITLQDVSYKHIYTWANIT